MRFNPVKEVQAYKLEVWYAWHPVLTEEGVGVWLENVLRGYDDFGDPYYRLP